MGDFFRAVGTTPVPTILVVAGIIFVFIALGGQFGAHIVTDRIKPSVALISGILMVVVGIGLYALSGGKSGSSDSAPSDRPATGDAKMAKLPAVEPVAGKALPAPEPPPKPRVLFTTGLNANNEPLNDVKQVTMSSEKIFIFSTWFGLTAGKAARYRADIYDGQNILVHSGETDFNPDTDSWNTWTWYKFKAAVDHPGIWTFKIYFGDQKTEERLVVTGR
jgi:hypothetical protein